MPAVTPTIEAREASKSSDSAESSSSFSCSGKNAKSSRCEKPVSNNGLEIGLGVGIPVFVIICILIFFLYKNYRKEKKEAMEHDPDFDENGDATALPDLPAFSKEDPFASISPSKRYNSQNGFSYAHFQNRSVNDLGSVTTKKGEEAQVDSFVLPYQNQIGSKASLHEFARNSGDMGVLHTRRGSDYSTFTAFALNSRESPHKSFSQARRSGTVTRATHGEGAGDFTKLHNKSTNSLGDDVVYNAKEISEESTTTKSSSDDQFGVEYENESKLAINSTLPSSNKNFALYSGLEDPEKAEESDLESVENYSDDEEEGAADVMEKDDVSSGTQDMNGNETLPTFDVSSPFEDKNSMAREVLPEQTSERNFAPQQEPKTKDENDSPELTNVPQGALKEPRMSAFDMLQNVSDEEAEQEISKKQMTAEQEEELARMKSVYKVYFDRTNSLASQKGDGTNRAFTADALQPLPSLNVDNLKLNSELKGDTAYDRRKTTTSSIYGDGAEMTFVDGQIVHPYQQFNISQSQEDEQSYPGHYTGPSYTHSGSPKVQNDYSFSQDSQQSPQDLLPLKSLPHASDIRNSTIETFTMYQPRVKVASPSMKQQQHYFDASSPQSSSQASFGAYSSPRIPHSGELPPVIRADSGTGDKPSASQLSRTSVVMLNPVNEIKTQRKFKPAGSLPSGMAQTGYLEDSITHGEDLIPGNRRSAVRRMMNSNF